MQVGHAATLPRSVITFPGTSRRSRPIRHLVALTLLVVTSSRKIWLIPVGVIAVAVVGFLAFGVFGVHTLFIDDKVNEENPFAAEDSPSGTDETDEAPDDSPDEQDAPAITEGTADDTTDDMTEEPVVETLADGSFVDRSHPAEGRAVVLSDGDRRFLRFEEFATDNGPDLFVYLSTAPPDAPEGDFDDDFVDLGRLKGNIGDQNYEIPADVDLGEHTTVVIWCKRFSVAFGAAPLT